MLCILMFVQSRGFDDGSGLLVHNQTKVNLLCHPCREALGISAKLLWDEENFPCFGLILKLRVLHHISDHLSTVNNRHFTP